MLSNQKIAYYLQAFPELTPEDFTALFQLATVRKLKAGEHYISSGSASKHVAYVVNGLIRALYIDEKGKEFTIRLHWEDQFFTSIDTVLRNRPSRFTYEAFEDTVLLEADYHKFTAFVDMTPRLFAAKTFFLQQMLAEALDRIEKFILLSPAQRYRQLVEDRPDLAQRIPSKHIATLLGITPVSLSRIRQRIAHSSKR